ncbi:PepSY-associated TM helix domain-containing protein [Pseudomarimonas arenosa]|uniref:PepSY-associated TM helix domain-containing protein n=1 Tax=Pseudomarimonas arenosa TaxID=2774145 RepID=A0AAW3ZHU7_9GAMM|nr:PepSY-associated TM helix domain-containing protein [Pseudomarimonas arenosa]MBD8525648.1 PepSY-associated TM helix domain-containing protein [Pseudomarimonas arenosa]
MTEYLAPAGRRAKLNKTLVRWHWISAAVSLIGMLLFSITGITLNHASQIGSDTRVHTHELVLPEAVLQPLRAAAQQKSTELPVTARRWLEQRIDIAVRNDQAEWSENELYLSMPRPGGDAWISIDLHSGELLAEHSDRGWLAYFNDLHKGRHTGAAWRWFIDLFAIACLVFCLTGLWLLALQAQRRVSTWPLVALGLVVPALIALLLIH